jgi:DNA-directed RNA polymerase specialized sigma54-like protein
MKQSLQLRTSQHLALTPQLQQSIRLLQLSTLELHQELEHLLTDNPLLEFLVQFERRQLQQADRLLQLRGERKVLGRP